MDKKNLRDIHIAVILFGLSGLFGKWIQEPPVVIVFGRTLIAALFLTGVNRIKKEELQFRLKEHYSIIFQGVLLAVHWAAFFHAIQLSNVAVALLTYSTFPLFTTIFEPMMFKSKLKITDFFTALLILIGVYLIFPDFRIDNDITKGALWGIFSGLSFALITLLNKKSVGRVKPGLIALVQNSTAALVLLPFAFRKAAGISLDEILFFLALGVICTGTAQLLYIRSLKKLKAQLVSVMAALEPVYGILFALILLGEVPSTQTVAGGLLIIGAVIYTSRKKITAENAKGTQSTLR